jgi:SAM-dependent methyltransferase
VPDLDSRYDNTSATAVPVPWPRSEVVAQGCVRLLSGRPLGRLLDAGGGAGLLTAYLLRTRVADTALVLDRDPVALAAVPPDIATRHGTIEDLTEADGRFSTILLRQVLHYSPEPDVTLRRLRDRLDPHGVLYVGQIVAPDPESAHWLGTAANWVSAKRSRVWTVDQMLGAFAAGGLRLKRATLLSRWQALDDQARGHRFDRPDSAGTRPAAADAPAPVRAAMAIEERHGTMYARVCWFHALLARDRPG